MLQHSRFTHRTQLPQNYNMLGAQFVLKFPFHFLSCFHTKSVALVYNFLPSLFFFVFLMRDTNLRAERCTSLCVSGW